jgi:lysophospholipase L1-like esterase
MSAAPLPQVAPRPIRRRRWWFAGIALLLGLFVGFVIAELLLRLLGWDFRSPYDFDAECGVRLRPGYRFLQSAEGRARISINSAGCRDVEHAVPKPAGVLRIAVLGDSFAEALQVELEETFWSVMGKALNECREPGGPRVEVLNFGVSGYGTTQELQTLRHHVWRYQPDVILLAFLPGNDVRNNSRDLEPDKGRPFYRRVGDRYELDLSLATDDGRPGFRESWWLRTKHRMATTFCTAALWHHWRQKRKPPEPAGGATPAIEAGVDAPAFSPPVDPKWTEAWNVTGMMLGTMNEEVNGHNARLVVVSLNNGHQVAFETDQAAGFDAGAAESAAAPAGGRLDFPDQRLLEFAKEYGFELILLTPPMRKLARQNRSYFHGFKNTRLGTGHWNVLGHQTAGELIAAEFCRHPEWFRGGREMDVGRD